MRDTDRRQQQLRAGNNNNNNTTVRISVTSLSDLTHTIREDMPVFPGEPLPRFQPIRTIGKDGASVTSIAFGSHTGTHVDAPSHFIPGAQGVDRIPLASFVGEAVVLDMSSKGEGEEETRQNLGIADADLEPYSGKVMEGDIVLLYTGTSDRWDDKKEESKDAAGRGATAFSYLEPSAAGWLVRHGAKCVGIDSFSVEKYGSKEGRAHKQLLSSGVGIVENLSSDLKRFVGRRAFFVCLPLPLEGIDASPARAVLFEIMRDVNNNNNNDDDGKGSSSTSTTATAAASGRVGRGGAP